MTSDLDEDSHQGRARTGQRRQCCAGDQRAHGQVPSRGASGHRDDAPCAGAERRADRAARASWPAARRPGPACRRSPAAGDRCRAPSPTVTRSPSADAASAAVAARQPSHRGVRGAGQFGSPSCIRPASSSYARSPAPPGRAAVSAAELTAGAAVPRQPPARRSPCRATAELVELAPRGRGVGQAEVRRPSPRRARRAPAGRLRARAGQRRAERARPALPVHERARLLGHGGDREAPRRRGR